ncbi:MAG: UDP binding domain-containing protein [Litorimonas sp.]
MHILKEHKANVFYHDPFIPQIPQTRGHPELGGMTSQDLKSLDKYDVAIITTDHTNVDYEAICKAVPLVVDTRNATVDIFEKYKDVIVKA